MSRLSFSGKISSHGLRFVRLAPVFLVACFLAVFQPSPAGAASAAKEILLGELAGWEVAGLNALGISDVTKGQGFTAGKTTVSGIPFQIVVFKPLHAEHNSVAFLTDTLRLSSLVQAVRGTALDDLELTKVAFILVGPGDAASAVALPAPVASHLGVRTFDLKAGLNLAGTTVVTGPVGDLMQYMDLARDGLRLAGTLDPAVLSGKPSPGQLSDAFIGLVDLSIPVKVMAPSWKPGFLSFLPSALLVKGVKDKNNRNTLAFGILTGIKVVLDGHSVTFDTASVSWDPQTRGVAINSRLIKPPAGLFALPGGATAIDSLGVAGTFAAGSRTVTLPGTFTVGGKPVTFTATLTGGANADYAIAMTGDVNLTQLAGWPLPGLDDITVTGVTIGNDYAEGSLTIANLPVTLAAFKGAGQKKFNVAFMFDDLKLSDLVAAALNTPFDDLQMAKPAIIVVPPENAARGVVLPDAVAAHLGEKALTLKPGANLSAKATASGAVGDLLDLVGAAKQGLTLAGTVDPRMLGGGNIGGQLAQDLLRMIDLRVPLGTMSIPGLPGILRASGAVLRVRGEEVVIGDAFLAGRRPDPSDLQGGPSVAIATTVALNVEGASLQFDSFVKLGTAGGQKFAVIKGTSGTWDKPLGVSWLYIQKATLDASLGNDPSVAVSGTADVGGMRNVKVSVDLATAAGDKTDFGVALTGVDLPIDELPGVGLIPNARGFKLRDVVVNSRAFAATTICETVPIFDGLRTVVFESGGKWALAMLHDDLSLDKLIKLSGPAKAMLDPLTLKKAALVLSEGGISGKLAELPAAARDILQEIYGDVDSQVVLVSGLNLVSEIDLGKTGAGLNKLIRPGFKPVFAGGVGGVFGGVASLELAAAIPPITFPKQLSFLDPPENLATSMVINLLEDDAAVGIQLSTKLDVKAKQSRVVFNTALSFQADTGGGFAIDVTGQSDGPWQDAMGIKGLTLNSGASLEIKATDTSQVTVTFIGLSDIGNQQVNLTGSVGVLAEGILDKGAFEGYVSELDLSDVVALSNAVVSAAGGKLPPSNFPQITLKNVDIAFASPGASVPRMGITDGGIRLAGELWFLIKERALGQFKGQIDGNGMVIAGDIADFDLGSVAMRNNSLDTKATVFPPEAYFKISGGGELFQKSLDFELAAGTDYVELGTGLDLGVLLDFDFKAYAQAPALGLSAADLAQTDLGVRAELKADLSAWLRTAGAKAVIGALGDTATIMQKGDAAIAAAKKKVDDLKTQISAMRAQVRKERETASKTVKEAQADVDKFADEISALTSDISSAESHIHTCDYTVKRCVWYDIIKRKCTKYASFADVKRDAQCELDNTKYGSIVAAKVTAKKSAEVAKAAADKVLSDVEKGFTSLDVDADPRVAGLIAARVAAEQALTDAQAATKDLGNAAQTVKNAILAAAAPGVFAVKDALVQGSLKGAIAGKPVIAALELEVLGKSENLVLALSFTDPAFTASQFEELAYLVAWKGLAADKKASQLLVDLVHAQYVAKYTSVESEYDKALKDNGLSD